MNRLSRYCDGLIEAVWLLAIIYIPLYFLLILDQPIGVGKTTMLRAVVLIGVAAWIAKWISVGAPRLERKSLSALWMKAASQPLISLAGALAAVYIISTAFSIAPLISLRGFYFRSEGLTNLLSYILLFALVAANLRRREQADRLITTWAAVSFAVDLYAILQHFGLDPIDWEFPVTTRAVSTIGHPIFLAAFLGMTLMLMLGRVVFLVESYRQARARQGTSLVLIALYLIVCALNLLSIWYCIARGPLIALFFGLLFFGVTLLAYWQLRRTFYVFVVAGIFLLIFTVVLNVPNGPLSGLRDQPFVGPLGHVFDAEAGTGRSRVLIWNGMLRLVTPHDPIQLPDHSRDRWNTIRPLVGYGPETISLVYENYYLPEMLALESYDLIHDHAHNEFWDVLALYGILGFLVEYGFFLSLIYFALKWLGWISSNLEHRLYWFLSLLGGLLGGIIAFPTAGAEFLGLGIPLGLLLGAVVILFLRIFRQNTTTVSKPDLWRDMILISSLALIVFHYVEILFGINVITSRVLFWVICGVMMTIGQGMLAEPGKAASQNDIRQIGARAGVIVAIIMALTPVLISGVQFHLDASTIIVNSLVSYSTGVLWVFLGIVLFTSMIFELESAVLSARKVFFPNLALLLGVALFASFLVWMLYASQLAAIWESQDLSSSELVARYINMLTMQFGLMVIFTYVWAFLLSESVNARKEPLKPPIIVGFGLIHVLALVLSIFINLRPFQANGIARAFNSYVEHGQYSTAVEVGKQMLELDPWQDAYFFGVADAAVDYANTLTGQQGMVEYLIAEEYYKQAYNLNPLYYHNVIGMAHIYRLWAAASLDPATRRERVAQSERFYAEALEGKPYRVKLWVEWADLREEFGDLQGARQKIDIAIKIDNTYAPAYRLSADLYLNESDKQSDPTKRAELLNMAAKDLAAGIEMMNRRSENPSFALLQLGDVYTRLQQYDQAREAYLQAEKLGLGDSQWKVYQKLAEVSGKMDNPASQREYLKQAIAIAPAEEISALQTALNLLNP